MTTQRSQLGTLRAAIAGNVRALRKARGMSQAELAHEAGLHRTYAGAIERAERNLSIDNLERIAKALGVTVADLVRAPDGRAEDRIAHGSSWIG